MSLLVRHPVHEINMKNQTKRLRIRCRILWGIQSLGGIQSQAPESSHYNEVHDKTKVHDKVQVHDEHGERVHDGVYDAILEARRSPRRLILKIIIVIDVRGKKRVELIAINSYRF